MHTRTKIGLIYAPEWILQHGANTYVKQAYSPSDNKYFVNKYVCALLIYLFYLLLHLAYSYRSHILSFNFSALQKKADLLIVAFVGLVHRLRKGAGPVLYDWCISAPPSVSVNSPFISSS